MVTIESACLVADGYVVAAKNRHENNPDDTSILTWVAQTGDSKSDYRRIVCDGGLNVADHGRARGNVRWRQYLQLTMIRQ